MSAEMPGGVAKLDCLVTRRWSPSVFGLLVVLHLLVLAGPVLASGFESPAGVTDLLSAERQRTSLALVAFSAPRQDASLMNGVLDYLEHNLMFRPGYEGKYTVSGHADLAALAAREAPSIRLDPLSIFTLKSLVSVDYLVFGDERLEGRTWIWRLRVYNGRSGAFVRSVETPLVEKHLSWTLSALLSGLNAIVKNLPMPPLPGPPPRDLVLPRSLSLLPTLKSDCLSGRCLSRLADLEWLSRRNPDLFADLMRNPLYANALQKEAQSPLDYARIALLQGNPMDASLRLEGQLAETKRRDLRIAYLALIGQAAMALGRPESAFEAFTELGVLDRGNPDVQFGLAWVHYQKERSEAALEILESLHTRHPDRVDVAELLIACHLQMRRNDRTWPVKANLARTLSAQGHHTAANALFLELLDHDFRWEWLEPIVIPLLSSVDRKSLATMLNQYGVVSSAQEVNLFGRQAELKLAENNPDEAGRILQGLVQLAPNNPDALAQSIWYDLEYGRNFARARERLSLIPARQRDSFMEAWVLEETGQHKEALDAWERGRFPASWKLEILIHRARAHAALGQTAEALALVTKALEIDRGREALYRMLYDLHTVAGDTERVAQAQAVLMQLGGKPYDPTRYPLHLLAEDYDALILPHPLVSVGQGERMRGVGKVAILNGAALHPAPGFRERLAVFSPYLPRVPDRVVEEIRVALSGRYDVAESRAAEVEFRKRLHPRHPNPQMRYSKSDLMGLSNTLGVDSLFVVVADETAFHDEERLELRVDLYFYDSVANAIYRTSKSRSLPYFAVYRFNMLLLVVPFAAMALLVFSLFRLNRLTRHLRNPLLHASYLIRQKNYRKAADVLERNGYVRDSLAMKGHQFFRQQDYFKAFESFFHARDYENAALCLARCPDTEEVNTLAAELYFQQREYDKAELYYRKTRNLLGIAKIFEARGKPKKAARIRGQYYFEHNNPVAAIEEYRRIADYDRAGYVFFYHGKYKEAALMFRQANNEEMYRKSMLRLGKRPGEAGG